MIPPRLRALGTPLALLAALCAGAVGGGLAVDALVSRSAAPLLPPDAEEPVYVTVAERAFGRTIPLAIRVDWIGAPLSAHLPGGIITELPSATFDAQDNLVLLKINDQPVVVALGETVMYRSLGRRTQGDDVKQLQEFLARGGFLAADLADGSFGASTMRAVRAFNESYGFGPRQDDIPLGRILFLHAGSYSLLTPLVVGQEAPATLDLSRLTADGPNMTGLMGFIPGLASGLNVYVEDLTEPLRVAAIAVDSAQAELELSAADSTTPCPVSSCPLVAPDTLQLIVNGRLELVSEQRGLAVPVSALHNNESGEAEVIASDGRRWPVQVVVVQDGLALVDGLPDSVREVRIG